MSPALAPIKPAAPPTTPTSSSAVPQAAPEMSELTDEQKYMIWKKNTPCLYDLILTHALNWPSLFVEFFRDTKQEESCNVIKILLGTHTDQVEQDCLMIMETKLPTDTDKVDYNPETGEYGGYGTVSNDMGLLTPKIIINHDREVNRARIMPQNPNIIASMSPSGKAYVFDATQHPSKPEKPGEVSAQLILTGHTCEGFSLCWNVHSEGKILTAAYDHKICLYDTNSNPTLNNGNEMQPKTDFSYHKAPVSAVQWHFFNENVFGSVSDDRSLAIFDCRSGKEPQLICENAHNCEVNCLDFHPKSEFLLLTGAKSGSIALWDMRRHDKASALFNQDAQNGPRPSKAAKSEAFLDQNIHSFKNHSDEIISVQWCPHNEHIFASASADSTVNIWNIDLIGAEQSEEDAVDGPPEMIFKHGGHRNQVSDLSWHLNDPMLIASVDDDNFLHMWKMSSDILNII